MRRRPQSNWGSQNAPNVPLKRGALIPCLPLPPPLAQLPLVWAWCGVWCVVCGAPRAWEWPRTDPGWVVPPPGAVIVRGEGRPPDSQGEDGWRRCLVCPVVLFCRHRKAVRIPPSRAAPCPRLFILRIRVQHGTWLKFDSGLSIFLMVRCRFPALSHQSRQDKRQSRVSFFCCSLPPCPAHPSPCFLPQRGGRVILARSLLAATEMMCSSSKCQAKTTTLAGLI